MLLLAHTSLLWFRWISSPPGYGQRQGSTPSNKIKRGAFSTKPRSPL
jgi:hypothetical protein